MRRALEARQRVEATGMAIDGATFARYLRAKAGGETVQQPEPADITKRRKTEEPGA